MRLPTPFRWPRSLIAGDPKSIIIALMILGLALRLLGISFGLPHRIARPDEQYVITQTLEILRSGSPSRFDYPTLYMNLLSLPVLVYYGFWKISGKFSEPNDFAAEWWLDPSNVFLIARCTTALLGALTVPAVYLLGKRIFSQSTGLLAAGLLSIAHLHVRDSHFATLDILLTLTCTIALLFIEKTRSLGSLRSFFTASLTCGLAISSKWNAIALAVPLAMYCCARTQTSGITSHFITLIRRMATCLVGGTLGILVGTPAILWQPQKFISDLSEILSNKLGDEPHAGIYAGTGFSYHLETSLWYGLGWPMLLAAVFGAVCVILKRHFPALGILAFLASYMALIGGSLVVMARYALPMVPTVCLLAASGVLQLTPALDRFRSRLVTILCISAISIAPLYRSIRSSALLARTDTRLIVGRWVSENVEPNLTIALVGDHGAHPRLFSVPEQIEKARAWMVSKGGGEGRSMKRLAELIAIGGYPTYHRLSTAAGIEGFTDVYTGELSTVRRPSIIVVPHYPVYNEPYLKQGRGPWLETILADEYVLVHSVKTWNDDIEYVFEPQDPFFLPFAQFEGIVRPGPGFLIYARRPSPE